MCAEKRMKECRLCRKNSYHASHSEWELCIECHHWYSLFKNLIENPGIDLQVLHQMVLEAEGVIRERMSGVYEDDKGTESETQKSLDA